jgi:hypothetical protein
MRGWSARRQPSALRNVEHVAGSVRLGTALNLPRNAMNVGSHLLQRKAPHQASASETGTDGGETTLPARSVHRRARQSLRRTDHWWIPVVLERGEFCCGGLLSSGMCRRRRRLGFYCESLRECRAAGRVIGSAVARLVEDGKRACRAVGGKG